MARDIGLSLLELVSKPQEQADTGVHITLVRVSVRTGRAPLGARDHRTTAGQGQTIKATSRGWSPTGGWTAGVGGEGQWAGESTTSQAYLCWPVRWGCPLPGALSWDPHPPQDGVPMNFSFIWEKDFYCHFKNKMSFWPQAL